MSGIEVETCGFTTATFTLEPGWKVDRRGNLKNTPLAFRVQVMYVSNQVLKKLKSLREVGFKGPAYVWIDSYSTEVIEFTRYDLESAGVDSLIVTRCPHGCNCGSKSGCCTWIEAKEAQGIKLW